MGKGKEVSALGVEGKGDEDKGKGIERRKNLATQVEKAPEKEEPATLETGTRRKLDNVVKKFMSSIGLKKWGDTRAAVEGESSNQQEGEATKIRFRDTVREKFRRPRIGSNTFNRAKTPTE